MSSLITELKNIGLSEKEAKVYLANLELGPALVADIAKKAGVNRATTYVILESLMQIGLSSKFDEGKKTFYSSNDPEMLESIFEVQKKEIDEKKKNLEKIIPQLRLIDNKKADKPIVKFFEGRQGMNSSITELYTYNDSLPDKKENEPLRMIFPKDRIPDFYTPEENQKQREMRFNRNIKSKVICTASSEVKSSEDGDRVKIDNNEFYVNADINIYGETVRIASLGKRISSILIKDKEIAETLKTLFDLAWEAAQKRSKK